MKFKKIRRVLTFKQSDWMRPYVDFNTQKRMISNNEADKNFFKLMNNSVKLNYGKWQNYGKFKKENENKSCKK